MAIGKKTGGKDFVPGNKLGGPPVGNTNAKFGRDYRRALKEALATKSGTDDYFAGLKMAAAVLVELAIDGKDLGALKEIGDRIDGKAAQELVHSGEDGSDPVRLIITHTSPPVA